MPKNGEPESDWKAGEPRFDNDEDCVMIRSVTGGPGWHDDGCTYLNNFLCETKM